MATSLAGQVHKLLRRYCLWRDFFQVTKSLFAKKSSSNFDFQLYLLWSKRLKLNKNSFCLKLYLWKLLRNRTLYSDEFERNWLKSEFIHLYIPYTDGWLSPGVHRYGTRHYNRLVFKATVAQRKQKLTVAFCALFLCVYSLDCSYEPAENRGYWLHSYRRVEWAVTQPWKWSFVYDEKLRLGLHKLNYQFWWQVIYLK